MAYRLAVDLGTTYTAAAVRSDGAPPAMVGLGNREQQIPSAVYVPQEGPFLVGEAAVRRGAADPSRLAREFKRRFGDPVPLVLGGQPFSATTLTSRLLRWVLETAIQRAGEPPSSLVVTCPVNWGAYKRSLFDEVIAEADVADAEVCPEPTAAALYYAGRVQMEPGRRLAVYDLGGGTFDACVLERTARGFEVVGTPEGIEHLGGVDFDEAVLAHVLQSLDGAHLDLDMADSGVAAALARLRRDCVDAKEALSTDVEALVAVSLPGRAPTTVRLGRPEFEGLIEPALQDTLGCLRRALQSANTEPHELATIVLVGGSSRIPLVARLLHEQTGVAPALDTHPKHDVALGATLVGLTPARSGPVQAPERELPPPDQLRPGEGSAPAAPAVSSAGLPSPGRKWLSHRPVLAGAAAAVVLAGAGAAWLTRADPSSRALAEAPQWRRVADLPVELEAAAVTAHRDEVWAAGGLLEDENRTKLRSVFVYDPAVDEWRNGPALPVALSHAALVSTPTGLFLLGGWVQEGGSQRVLRLDEARQAWVDDVPLPGPRVAGAAAYDGSRLIFAGGTRPDNQASDQVWGLSEGRWEELGRMQHGRQKLAAVSNRAGLIWLLGGHDQTTGTKFTDVDLVSEGRVRTLPPTELEVAPAVDSAAALRLDGGGPCLLGGQTPEGFNGWWCEDPSAARRLPVLRPARAGLGVARVGETIYVVGGYGRGDDGMRRVEALDLPDSLT